MVKPSSLESLNRLKQNNSKEWFEQNREGYEDYRINILQFADELLQRLTAHDPAISDAQFKPKRV